MDHDPRLDAIVHYNMDEAEARAYKIMLIWIDMSREVFPNYTHTRIKKGNPTKSLIFRMCHKLQRERKGILTEEEYPLYVRAQLEVLKHIGKYSEVHPSVDVGCLCGDKAWVRWKIWKRKYDLSTKWINQAPVAAPEAKILEALESTRDFLVKTFSGQPTLQQFGEAVTNRNVYRWITVGKISPYYLLLSPYIEKSVGAEEIHKAANYDLDVFAHSITPDVQEFFERMFEYEFEGI